MDILITCLKCFALWVAGCLGIMLWNYGAHRFDPPWMSNEEGDGKEWKG